MLCRLLKNIALVVALGGVPLLIVGCAGSQAKDTSTPDDKMTTITQPMAENVEILGKVAGDQLPIKSHGLGLINAAALGDLGLRETFAAEGVELDLAEHSVILFSLGKQPTGGYAADINGLQRKGDQLYVQATAIAPNTDEATTEAVSYPYCAVAVKKLPGGITVLSDITSLP